MDDHFQFVGRWDQSDPSVYKSYWGGAYVKVLFTGRTVKIKLAYPASLMASLDGQEFVPYPAVSGLVDLTPNPLSAGTHTLTVAARGPEISLAFQGLVLDADAKTIAPARRRLIEFVGDSISEGKNSSGNAVTSFPWIAAERLNADHIQIAKSGICLQSGCYACNVGFPTTIGMDQQFFMMRPPGQEADAWDFSSYQPELVVLNLGTNDNSRVGSEPAKREQFRMAYIHFVNKIRMTYPSAKIALMRTFGGYLEAETRQAVTSWNQAGDSNVHYVDTSGWLDARHFAPNDSVHPLTEGHLHAGHLLASALSRYL